LQSAFTVGTCVTVVGVPSVFNGLIEFTANKITATATADITAKAAVTAEVAGITGLSNSDTQPSGSCDGHSCQAGAVTMEAYGCQTTSPRNVTIGNNETLSVYLHKSNDHQRPVRSLDCLAVGDEVEFTGWIANYKAKTTAWAAGISIAVLRLSLRPS
jgi:hypothetical protein